VSPRFFVSFFSNPEAFFLYGLIRAYLHRSSVSFFFEVAVSVEFVRPLFRSSLRERRRLFSEDLSVFFFSVRIFVLFVSRASLLVRLRC